MGLPQALRAFANDDRGSGTETGPCCQQHDREWRLFLRRVDMVPLSKLIEETSSRFEMPNLDDLRRRARDDAEADFLIREQQARQRQQEREIADIKRKRMAVMVTNQQSEAALRYLERKQA